MIHIKPTEFIVSLDIKGATSIFNIIETAIEHKSKTYDSNEYKTKSIEVILKDEFGLLKSLDEFLNIGAYNTILNDAQKEFENLK